MSWWSRISHTFSTQNRRDFGSDRPSSSIRICRAGGQLPRLDPARQVDLLRGVEERDLADLLEVHPDRVVRGRLEQVDLDADLGGGVGLLAGDLDDLDALGGEVVLHLGEELLHLLGGEVVHRDGFQQVLRGHETALAPSRGDGFLYLVQAHQFTGWLRSMALLGGSLRGDQHDGMECTETQGRVTGRTHDETGSRCPWRRRRRSPSTATSSLNRPS